MRFIYVILFLFMAQNLVAQCPEVVDAGTVTVNNDGGTNMPFVVCFGDAVDLTNNGDFILPTTGPAPELMFALYNCPPTDPDDPGADPCYDNSFWTGANFQTTNDGGIVDFMGQNTFWMVPIAADNGLAPPAGPNYDSNNDDCFDINIDQVVMFTFLDEILFDEVNIDECTGEVEIEIEGGYAALFPGSYNVVNTGDGNLSQSGSNGETILITGLQDGDSYSFDVVDDGAGCSASYAGGSIDQNIPSISFSYDPICYNGDAFPNFATPGGGTFSFDNPPGDGAFIDPFSGEITNAQMDYDVVYTVMGDCADFQEIFTVMVLPPIPEPEVIDEYVFCESDDTTIIPIGNGDFFTLYEEEETENDLATGSDFIMADFVTPGQGPVDFYISQTIDGCESDREVFSVEILSESPPDIAPLFELCEGDAVTLYPISTHGDDNFNFYANAALTDLLASGSEYTFTPTMDMTIYITELNGICETEAVSTQISVTSIPTGITDPPVCAADNLTYSIPLSSDAVSINPSAGTVIDHMDGNFTIINIPSGQAIDIELLSGLAGCSQTLSLGAFDCGCNMPNAPINPVHQTICAGQMIPPLSVTVGAGVAVDWYDAAVGGNLLLANSASFTPTMAGTYYAEARDPAEDCVNTNRLAVNLTIEEVPVLVSATPSCAADLQTYSVDVQLTNAASIQPSVGTVSGGPDNFTISAIPVGVGLTYTAFTASMNCSAGPFVIDAPTCDCPSIDPPTGAADITICEGDAMPTLMVSVGADETADWYDMATGGALLLSANTSFTPALPATYYVETRNTINNCVSSRIAVSVIVQSNPSYVLQSTNCAADLLTYNANISVSNADNISVNTGTIVDNGAGNYSITAIAAGTDLELTLTHTASGCSQLFTITAPDCNCLPIDAPLNDGDQMVCADEVLPSLSVSVGAGLTVDWYDAASGGNLLLANSLTYTPTAAGVYYAQARNIADGCVSAMRTAVTLVVNVLPVVQTTTTNCAADLLTYDVFVQTTDGASLQASVGTVTNVGADFTIANIPVGTDVTYTVFNSNMSCSVGPTLLSSPLCPCPAVSPPVVVADVAICDGDPIPTLTVSVGADETADWYDMPVGGISLLSNSTSYTPLLAGTYYVEARNTVNNCVSSRVPITIIAHPNPSFSLDNTACAVDLLSYDVNISVQNADQVSSNTGTLTDQGMGVYLISGIAVGVDLELTLENSITGCNDMFTIAAPDCSCGLVVEPMSGGDQDICTGDVIPALEASVAAGQTVDWYDAASGGNLLLANSSMYTPTLAGTYYAETRVLADNCTSPIRTAVSLSIAASPSLVSADLICAADLQSYTLELQLNDAASIQTNAGTIVNNGAGSFTVSGIPIATAIEYTAFNASMNCSLGPNVLAAPACPCPDVMPASVMDVAICEGELIPALLATVGANETVDWYDAASGGNLLLANSLAYTPTTAGTYYAITRNTINACLSEAVAVTLTIHPLPTIVGELAACAPDLNTYTVDFSVQNADVITSDYGMLIDLGAMNYQLIDIPVGQDVNLSFTNSTTMCASQAMISAPDCSCPEVVAPLSMGDVLICSDEAIPALSVSVDAGIGVNWYDAPVGGNLLLANSTTYQPSMAGVYYAEAEMMVNACVSSSRTALTLEIHDMPQLINAETLCDPSLMTYTVNLVIENAFSITSNAGDVLNNGGGNFVVSNLPIDTDLAFSASNATATCVLDNQLVAAPDCPCPAIAIPISIGDVSICEGEAIPNLSVTVQAEQTADWYDAPTGGNLLLSASTIFTPTMAGVYYVEARNTVNNCVSERIAIQFDIHPIPTYVVEEAICAPDLLSYTVNISIQGADMIMANVGMVQDNGAGSYTLSAIPADADVELEVINSLTGCSLLDIVLAPDCPCPLVDLPTANDFYAICQGDVMPTLEASVDADHTVDWYDAPLGGNLLQAASLSFVPTMAGTYYAETRNTINNCVSDERLAIVFEIYALPELLVDDVVAPHCNMDDGQVILLATGNAAPFQYAIQGNAFQPDPSFTDLAANTYTFVVQDANGCENTTDFDLLEPEAVLANAGQDQVITCNVPIVALDASASDTGADIIYQWADEDGVDLGQTSTPFFEIVEMGTYTLTVINTQTLCESTDVVSVTQDVNPPIVNAGADQEIGCDVTSVALSASAQANANLSYQWTAQNGGVLGANTNALDATAQATGQYIFMATNTVNGCMAADTLVVDEVQAQFGILDIDINTPDCFGDTNASIHVMSTQSELLYALDESAYSPTAAFNGLAAGVYTLHIEDINGCQKDSTLSIDNGVQLSIDLGPDVMIHLGDSVLLEAEPLSLQDDLAQIIWTPNTSLQCDTCLMTYTHNLYETTIYQLQVIDSLGCTASDDIRITVDKGRQVYVPNAFSPNNDGVNDLLMVNAGDDVREIKSFQVFNRWGELVFEKYGFQANVQEEAWDGSFRSGQELNAAVLVYVLEVEFIDGAIEVFSGDVMLMK